MLVSQTSQFILVGFYFHLHPSKQIFAHYCLPLALLYVRPWPHQSCYIYVGALKMFLNIFENVVIWAFYCFRFPISRTVLQIYKFRPREDDYSNILPHPRSLN